MIVTFYNDDPNAKHHTGEPMELGYITEVYMTDNLEQVETKSKHIKKPYIQAEKFQHYTLTHKVVNGKHVLK